VSDVPRLKHLKDTELASFRADRALLENLRTLAEKNERTFSQEIRLALVKHVKAATETA
jgi:hypothetical protein